MCPSPESSDPSVYRIERYTPAVAATIASWAPTASELLWLAPGTPPPLTPEKVAAWGCTEGQRFLLWDGWRDAPVGYGELDYLSPLRHQMWVGHFVIAPAFRGQGLGLSFARGLLRMAFDRYSAQQVVLLVFPENVSAVRCYERAGFVGDGREAKYFERIRAEHTLLRMSINRDRFRRVTVLDRTPDLPLPSADVETR